MSQDKAALLAAINQAVTSKGPTKLDTKQQLK